MKRSSTTAALLSSMLAVSLPAAPAGAQGFGQRAGTPMVCGERAEIVRQLGERYGETRRSAGLARGQGIIEVYASEETGSWTILITSPQGTACLMAAGEAFQPEPVMAAGKPA